MKNALTGLMVLCSLCAFVACTEKGEFEKAGERTDEIIDNVKEGDPVLHKKGPIEKAGEAADEVVDNATE